PNCIGNFVGAFQGKARVVSGSARVDYDINSKLNLIGRYAVSPSSQSTYNSAADISGNWFNTGGISPSNKRVGSHSATIGLVHLISPTINNDLRFNYTRSTLRQAQMTPSAFNGDLSTLFPEGFAQPPSGLSLRDMALSFQFLGLVPSLTVGDGTSSNRQLHFNAVDTLSMVKGSHALKLGADFRALYPNISSAPYNFSANFWSPIGAAPCNSSQPMPGAPPTPGAPAFTCGNSTDLSVTYGSGDFRFQNW